MFFLRLLRRSIANPIVGVYLIAIVVDSEAFRFQVQCVPWEELETFFWNKDSTLSEHERQSHESGTSNIYEHENNITDSRNVHARTSFPTLHLSSEQEHSILRLE